MDVRFLPNPHWEEHLRPLTGHDPAVRDFVLERADTSAFLERLDDLLRTAAAGLRGRGQQLPDDRHRLHRRPPPLRRHRRGARQPPPRPRHRRPHHPPRRDPVAPPAGQDRILTISGTYSVPQLPREIRVPLRWRFGDTHGEVINRPDVLAFLAAHHWVASTEQLRGAEGHEVGARSTLAQGRGAVAVAGRRGAMPGVAAHARRAGAARAARRRAAKRS